MVKTISLNGLTIEEASSYLIKNGFTVGSNKPSDYACRGLILQGMRNVDNGGTNSYKFYYNPIVLPEFMTASILKKGRWLDIGSQQNYTKLTDLDVYAGRLGTYLMILKDETLYGNFFKDIDERTALPLRHFFSDVTYWYQKSHKVSPACLIGMDERSIHAEIAVLHNYLLQRFSIEEAVDAYLDWARWQYFMTFNTVFGKHINGIKAIPLTAIQTKIDEDKVNNFHKNKNSTLLSKIIKRH